MGGYGKNPFGTGPYGNAGGTIIVQPHPLFGGYGGLPYGFSPFGGIPTPAPPFPVSGGYGGYPYGFHAYGSIGTGFPSITGALSIDGFNIEVFFDQEMLIDTALLDPASYTFTPLIGAPCTAVSVSVGTTGTNGATSIIITHTGTTLGGNYKIVAVGPSNISGQPISGNAPKNEVTLLTKGDPPPYTIIPISGNQIVIDFDEDMLTEAEFTPGIEDPTAYQFTTTYPVPITILSITHPYNGDVDKVLMEIQGMTSVPYSLTISPADAIVYDGTFLPSLSTTFTGTELGTGQSISGATGLLMTKLVGAFYGWGFGDTSGKLIPGSSYRTDVTFDVSAAVITPPLFDTTFATITVSDGAQEFVISLLRVGGVDTVTVTSGVYTATFSANWSAQETTVSFVRNQKANIYSTLVNGQPFATVLTGVPTGAPTIPNGVQFILDPGGVYNITQLPLRAVNITSTQTVFSSAWNFLHGQQSAFTGSAALTKDYLLTDCGPLVKGWGDATPATEQDVTLRVNSVEVVVEDVNPYVGKIFPEVPIPLMPPGTMEVDIDYTWWKSPVMEFAGLNTEGLVLNKWDLYVNRSQSRFPFGLVLGPFDDMEEWRRKPLLLGHRYIGFEKAYSALLNSPTTLLLNEDPHKVSRMLLSANPVPEAGEAIFTDLTTPTSQGWALTGVDGGGIEGLDPIWVLKDEVSGPYGEGDVTVYSQDIDTSVPTSILMSVWFTVDETSVEYDGVFSGVGFGVHNDQNLYLVGCLKVNDVLHVGTCVDPGLSDQIDSWQLAYESEITILDSTTFSVSQASLPEQSQAAVDAGVELRFQIFEGSQTGVYTLTHIVLQSDGTATITINSSNPFPANPSLFGNRDATGFFESKWDGTGLTRSLSIYRLIVKSDIKLYPDGQAELFIGSTLTGRAMQVTGVPTVAIPPDSVLVIPTGIEGQIFWGSFSRRAVNTSEWSFVRYSITPDQNRFSTTGIVVSAEMNELPENDSNNVWFKTQEFGTAIIDSSGDTMLLKAASSNEETGVEGQDLTIGYGRIEPFLTRSINIDVDAVFRVESGTSSAGDAQIEVGDTERFVRLSTILYEETPSGAVDEKRRLLEMPSTSLSGLQTPEDQNWQLIDPGPEGPVTDRVQGQVVTFTQTSGQRIIFTDEFDSTELLSDNRILEARLRFGTVTTSDPGGNTDIFIGADAGPLALPRSVGIRFRKPEGANPARVVVFSPESGLAVSVHDFDWEDGEFHDYRIIIDSDADAVTLSIDDSLISTDTFTSFDASTVQTRSQIGFVGADTTATVDLDSFSNTILPPSTATRTLGVWLGGDATDINNWEIPRTDTLNVPNSYEGVVVEEMDWRSDIQVRVHRDPTWGVTILRPDLPPPPYFTGDFATQMTEPSAGWINVEYRNLPVVKTMFGSVAFGSLDARSITQQRWREVRFRIFPQASEDFIPLPHSVLNQHNIITSGEFTDDLTVEVANVISEDTVTIDLKITNITADRIFNVIYLDQNGLQVVIDPEFLIFDRPTQVITINSDALEEAGSPFTQLPGDHWPVTVNYAPGKPITKTYLQAQPLLDSQTLLNEGTPPFPKSQIAPVVKQVAFGSRINDPNDTLNDDPDFILNDPFRYVDYEDEEAALYDCMEFFSVDNGGDTGLISTLCDSPVKGQGFMGMEISGTALQEYGTDLQLSDGESPEGACILELSGGPNVDGVLGDCVLLPLGNFPGDLPMAPGGKVIWPVIGSLVDPATGAVEVVYFTRGSPAP